MRFVKISGAIRHSDIQNELEKIGLKDTWIHFFLGQTMCSLDENVDISKLDNQGVYPVDLERFCYTNEIHCEITD